MFDRLISLIGIEKFNKIKKQKILLLGVGGVGGYVAEALIRSGIHNLTIVDSDIIDETNLNRQIIALHSTIGKCKVNVLKNRLEDINPEVQITSLYEKIESSNLEKYDLLHYDYIIDCIDDIAVKVNLAKYALHNQINLVTSTGTAKKLHPELLNMTTLDKTSYDPLAKKMRTLLKGEKINKLTVLASTEQPIKTESKSLGSSAFVPSSGGLLIASYIINKIIE